MDVRVNHLQLFSVLCPVGIEVLGLASMKQTKYVHTTDTIYASVTETANIFCHLIGYLTRPVLWPRETA